MKFSVIVPVYNRPDEIKELLESLSKQTQKNFEVIIVEDGSTEKAEDIALSYKEVLDIQYFYKENEKPAIARNFGAKHATGDYLLFFDSDCIIPPTYFDTVTKKLECNYTDAYGGPDAASGDFNDMQKAISYAMTSFFTTGGIRGSSEKIDKFYPRSFNMGVSAEVFNKLGGFPVTKMHPGEDMVFSVEIIKNGYTTQLIKDAFAYHKRRNTLRSFHKQVFNFGKVRVIISKLYPKTNKLIFWLPTLMSLGTILLIWLAFLSTKFLFPLALYSLAIFVDSYIKNEDPKVAGLSIVCSFTQIFGYGFGYLSNYIKVHYKKIDEFNVFSKGFYPKS